MIKRNTTPSLNRFTTSNFAANPFNLGWESMYEGLIEYKDYFGHCDVPKDYVTKDGLNLGNWLNRQVSEHTVGKLDMIKVKRLKEVGLSI